jgi:hypothetical protein
MKSRRLVRSTFGVLAVLVVFTSQAVQAALPSGNSVQQWNKISEDTVVSSGAFGNEGLKESHFFRIGMITLQGICAF